MNDREKWRERVRDIRAGGTTYDDDDEISKSYIWLMNRTQVYPFRAWVDLEAMAIKDYSVFPKALSLQETYYLIV